MIEFLTYLVVTYGYLGVFLVSLIGSAALFVPVPAFLIVISAGATLDPFWVGIVAGLGAGLGETVGYLLGIGIVKGASRIKRKLTPKEKHWISTVKDWFSKGWGPLAIFVFAATPLPDKILGLVCGALRYDWKKFLFATLAGKILLHLILAYIGYFGVEFFLNLLGL